MSIALLLLQFVVPFLFLLSRDLKRNPQVVKWVALGILVMRVVDLTWNIGPVFRHEGSTLHWLDFAVVLGMGGSGCRCSGATSRVGRSCRRATRTTRKRWPMSDTNHHHAPSGDPVEFDAVSYSGIVWFVVILTGTVLAPS